MPQMHTQKENLYTWKNKCIHSSHYCQNLFPKYLEQVLANLKAT